MTFVGHRIDDHMPFAKRIEGQHLSFQPLRKSI
jgi:hypothetical protein